MGKVKEYNGELHLNPEMLAGILNLVQAPISSKNVHLRDGLQYSFTLHAENLSYSANFDDTNLPDPLRDLLASVEKRT